MRRIRHYQRALRREQAHRDKHETPQPQPARQAAIRRQWAQLERYDDEYDTRHQARAAQRDAAV
jgi:hypothetical protein